MPNHKKINKIEHIMKNEIIKGYMLFDSELKYEGVQYEVGREYEAEVKDETLGPPFHFHEHPLQLFEYSTPVGTRVCEVEGSGIVKRNKTFSQSTHLRIVRELNLLELINASIEASTTKSHDEKSEGRKVISSDEECSALLNSKSFTVVASTGYNSVAGHLNPYSSTGSIAANIGSCSVAACSGSHDIAVTAGTTSIAVTTGTRSMAVNKGKNSIAACYGNESIAIGSAAARVCGRRSLAMCTNIDGIAAGVLGSWLVLIEREEISKEICWEGKDLGDEYYYYPIKDVKAFRVDGKKIKANTFYKLVGGEAVAQYAISDNL